MSIQRADLLSVVTRQKAFRVHAEGDGMAAGRHCTCPVRCTLAEVELYPWQLAPALAPRDSYRRLSRMPHRAATWQFQPREDHPQACCRIVACLMLEVLIESKSTRILVRDGTSRFYACRLAFICDLATTRDTGQTWWILFREASV